MRFNFRPKRLLSWLFSSGICLILGLFGSLWSQTQPDTLAIPDSSHEAVTKAPISLSDSVSSPKKVDSELFQLLLTDSMILYTDHEHFGDILALFPGIFVFNLGSVGQPVTASFLPTPRPLLQLRVNEIPIIDPETNQVDWNWLPVEAVARLGTAGHLFSANTIQVSLHHMAGQVPESKIVYHTGSKDFDKFDASLGLRLSEKRTLQLGGTIKNYHDPGVHSKYDAVKARIELHQQLKPGWDALALFYLNRDEVQQLLPTFSSLQPPVTKPAEKVIRHDYGLVINGQLFAREHQDFKLIVHHARLNREFHDWPLQRFWQNHLDLSGLELSLSKSVRKLDNRMTLGLRRQAIASPELGDHCDWHFIGKWKALVKLTDRFFFAAGLVAEKYGQFNATVLPAGLFEFRPGPKTLIQLGSQASRFYPSFRERFQQTGPIKGNSALAPGEFFENYLAIRSLNRRQLGLKFSYSSLKNALASESVPNHEHERYFNRPQSRYFTTALDFSLPLLSWITMGGLGNYSKKLKSGDPDPWPDFFANAFIMLRRNLFQDNLDLTIRLGGQFWGYRPTSLGQTLTPVLIPAARVTGQIGAVTLFLSLHNFIDSQYDLIYGYPMRNITLSWGLTWRFFD